MLGGDQLKYSKVIVAAVIVLAVSFTAVVLYISYRDHAVPDSLIVAWFAFITGELWALASIRKTKAKKGEKNDEI